jgi:predicted amidohydrolase
VRPPLSLAVSQPYCVAQDVAANAVVHGQTVRAAGARIVVFPELSLTGYELEAAAIDPGDRVLEPVVQACRETGSTALVGAPISGPGGQIFIAMLEVSSGGVRVLYRKRWLGDDEATRFSAGDPPTVLEVDGWRIGVGICKDTGVREHVARIADMDVDAYCAGLVHLPEELGQLEDRARAIAGLCRAFVAFASFAGHTGAGYTETAGSSAIWSPTGEVLARAGTRAGEIARATLETP